VSQICHRYVTSDTSETFHIFSVKMRIFFTACLKSDRSFLNIDSHWPIAVTSGNALQRCASSDFLIRIPNRYYVEILAFEKLTVTTSQLPKISTYQ